MKFSENDFLKVWEELAKTSHVDGAHGAEYRRSLEEWSEEGSPDPREYLVDRNVSNEDGEKDHEDFKSAAGPESLRQAEEMFGKLEDQQEAEKPLGDVNQDALRSAVKSSLEQMAGLSQEEKVLKIDALRNLLRHEMPAVDWQQLFPALYEEKESDSSAPASEVTAPQSQHSQPTTIQPAQPSSQSQSQPTQTAQPQAGPSPTATPAPPQAGPSPTTGASTSSSKAKKFPRNVGPRRRQRDWFQKLLPQWHQVIEGMPNQWKANKEHSEHLLTESQRLAVKHRQQAAAAKTPEDSARHIAHAERHEHNIEQQKFNIAHWGDSDKYALNLVLPQWASFLDMDRPEEYQGNAPQVQIPSQTPSKQAATQAQSPTVSNSPTVPTAATQSQSSSPTVSPQSQASAATSVYPASQNLPQTMPVPEVEQEVKEESPEVPEAESVAKTPARSNQPQPSPWLMGSKRFSAQMPNHGEFEVPESAEMPHGDVNAPAGKHTERDELPEYQGARSSSEKSHFPSMAGAMTEGSDSFTSRSTGSDSSNDMKELVDAIKTLIKAVEANTEAVKEMASSQKHSQSGSMGGKRSTGIPGGEGARRAFESLKQAKEAVAGAGNAMMGRTGSSPTSRKGPAMQGGVAQAAGAVASKAVGSEVIGAAIAIAGS